VYVEGKLRTRQWQDKDGNTRYTTEVHADDMTLLDRPTGDTAAAPRAPASATAAPSAAPAPFAATPEDDDLPF
jgi:single-strand DNA-binding protein